MKGFRISVLWAGLAPHSVAFCRALAEERGCAVQLIHQPIVSEAPFEPFDLSFCQDAAEDGPSLRAGLQQRVRDFQPDCVLMASWGFRHFYRICVGLRRQGVYVVAQSDNQWKGTAKQRIGAAIARWYLHPGIDTMFIPGDRQARLAHRLGFGDPIYGSCAPDIDLFRRGPPIGERMPAFVYAGRLIPLKGIAHLAAAYGAYRASVGDPWDLVIAGVGPEQHHLEGLPGVRLLGFVQPRDMPAVLHAARCFILPSRIYENWGVVLHEAAAAGLPIICTRLCGASDAYVRDGVNGCVIGLQEGQLARALHDVAAREASELEEMSQVSRLLGCLWDQHKAARHFVAEVRARHAIG